MRFLTPYVYIFLYEEAEKANVLPSVVASGRLESEKGDIFPLTH